METPNDHDLLDAFADGELDETQHAEAAERFRQDAESRAYVDDVTRLRESLRAMWSSESAPVAVRRQVREALGHVDVDEAAPVDEDSECGDVPGLAWSPWRVPLAAVAATIVLGITVWLLWPPERGRPVQVSPMVVRDVSTAVKLYREAAADELGADARIEATTETEARRALSSDLEIKVLVPDLSSRGFVFAGAGRCVVEEMPAAHAWYRREDGRAALSLFSAKKIEKLRSGGVAAGVLEVFVARRKDLTALAWHAGPATYVACADLPTGELMSVLGLSNATARVDWPLDDLPEFGSLVMNPPPSYDEARPVMDQAPQGSPTVTPVARRSARPGVPPGLQWIGLIRRAIVMGCS